MAQIRRPPSSPLTTLTAVQEFLHVLPATRHGLSLAELMVLRTRPIQRMARLRQTGLAYLFHPTSEHSRLSHCLGTAYWASRFLDAMRKNRYSRANGVPSVAGNERLLRQMARLLGNDLSLDLVTRLYALVHDAALLPLGHTLGYQLGYCASPGDPSPARISAVLEDLRADLGAQGHPADVLNALVRHLDAVEAVCSLGALRAGRTGVHSRWPDADVISRIPCLTFIESLVTGAVSADLVDFALRDSVGTATPWRFDSALLDSMCVFIVAPDDGLASALSMARGRSGASKAMVYAFGFGIVGGSGGDLEPIFDLLNARCDVFEALAFESRKVGADAMLDRGLADIVEDSGLADPLPPVRTLLKMGDDSLLDFLQTEEQCYSRSAESAGALSRLRSGQTFDELLTIRDRTRLSPPAASAARAAPNPRSRRGLERQIAERIRGLSGRDVVVSLLPTDGQIKAFDTMVGWHAGEPVNLEQAANVLDCEAVCDRLVQRHLGLWSLAVHASARAAGNREELEAAARQVLERHS